MPVQDQLAQGEGSIIVALTAIRKLMLAIFLILLFTMIYFARALFLPLVLAVLITLTLSPMVRALGRIGVPAAVSAVVLMMGIGGAIIMGAYLLVGPITELLQAMPEIGRALSVKFEALMQRALEWQHMAASVMGVPQANAITLPENPITFNWVSAVLASAAGNTASLVATLGAAFMLAMFLLASDGLFQRHLVEVSPSFTDKKRALVIMRDVEREISRYLGSITLINIGLGAAIGLAFYVIGLPYVFLWAVAVFLLNYIPYLGSVVGTAAAFAVAVVTFDSLTYALLAPAAYYVFNTLENQVVTPLLVGRRMAINAPAIFVAVIVWVWMWGIAGALLAVPFLVVIKVVCENIPAMAAFGRFLADQSSPRVAAV